MIVNSVAVLIGQSSSNLRQGTRGTDRDRPRYLEL